MNIFDVVIIGSGLAGYTAGIYTSRAFLKTLIIAGPQPGGQLTTTTEVENFPGFPEGIQGPELLDKMRKQAERFGAEIIMETGKTVRLEDNKTFTVIIDDTKIYKAKSLIIATGGSAKTLGIPSEEKFRGKGISYCATCDGFFFRGKHIAVLGGGDTAMEEATFLTRFADKVTIIHRREEFRASPIMLERAKKNSKISFLLNKEIVEFYGDSVLKGVRIRNTTNPTRLAEAPAKRANATNTTNGIQEMPFDGVFVAIGNTPATTFLKDFIALDEKGYVVLKKPQSPLDPQTRTSVDGVFAAGDCVDSRYRQGIVAAGMGCMAAMDAEKYLEK